MPQTLKQNSFELGLQQNQPNYTLLELDDRQS